jgi:hypothetical protein
VAAEHGADQNANAKRRHYSGVLTAPLRGIGDIATKFVAESFLDEVTLKRGVDPMQFRLELLKITPRGQKILQRVAKMADWSRKRETTAS